jgi:hypothetical protein
VPLPLTCAARCIANHFLNTTTQTCINCTVMDALCRGSTPAPMFFSGGGCYDNPLELSTMNISQLVPEKCVTCDRSSCDVGKYLNTEAKPCACANCVSPSSDSEIGKSRYISQPCGGKKPLVVKDCTLTCSSIPNQWLKGSCTPNTTGVCVACTTYFPAMHRVKPCGNIADALWVPCGRTSAGGVFTPGFYCTGDGNQTACPHGRTSLEGASAEAHCHCPVGTKADGAGCTPEQPLDATLDDSAPAPGWISSKYMMLNASDGLKNTFVDCGAGAKSKGDGIGLSSCMCPAPNYYATIVGDHVTACTPCPTVSVQCSGTNDYLIRPNTCWRTGRLADTCTCVPPPFTQGSNQECSQSALVCATGFDRIGSSTPSRLMEPSTGSPMYVQNTNTGWRTHIAPESGLPHLQELAVTSDVDVDAFVTAKQFALWFLKDHASRGYVIYTMPVTANLEPYSPYESADGWWSLPLSGSEYSYAMQCLAVAKWSTNNAADVGVVAMRQGSDAVNFYRASIMRDVHPQQASWSAPFTTPILLASGTPQQTCRANAHAYIGSTSTFYVALQTSLTNNVSLVTVSSGTTVTRPLPHFAGRGISAMTLITRADNQGVYLFFAQPGVDTLWMVDPSTPVETPPKAELFHSVETLGEVRQLAPALWGSMNRYPLFIALVQPPLAPVDTGLTLRDPERRRRRLYMADYVQRTLVPIQGLDWNRTQPELIAGIGLTYTTSVLLVASTGGRLFTRQVLVCGPPNLVAPSLSQVPRFWDGDKCQSHMCVRARSCSANELWSPNDVRCVCAPGFTKPSASAGACVACLGSFYCPGGLQAPQTPCPSTLTTLTTGAASLSACVCGANQYYETTDNRCKDCPKGAWCPNRWTKMSCPGAFDPDSEGTLTLPYKCACAQGATHARCDACPENFVCPRSTTLIRQLAVLANLRSGTSPSPISDVCERVKGALTNRLSTFTISYLKEPMRLALRLSCTLVPSPSERPQIAPQLALTLVLDASTDDSLFDANLFNGVFSNADLTVTSISGPAITTVFNNTQKACDKGRVPAADRINCVCAPGFSPNAASCSMCPVGRYKPYAGPSACIDCPLGTTSFTGATQCVAYGANRDRNTSTDSATPGAATDAPLGLIIGGTVGGVVLVGGLIWAFTACAPS